MLVLMLGMTAVYSSCSKDNDNVEDIDKTDNPLIGTAWSDKHPVEFFTVEFKTANKCTFSITSVKSGENDSFDCIYAYSKDNNSVTWTWDDGFDDIVVFKGQIEGENGITMRVKETWNGKESSDSTLFYKIK